jgi:hypothetical protein
VTIPIHGGREIGPPLFYKILRQLGLSLWRSSTASDSSADGLGADRLVNTHVEAAFRTTTFSAVISGRTLPEKRNGLRRVPRSARRGGRKAKRPGSRASQVYRLRRKATRSCFSCSVKPRPKRRS